MRYRSFLQIFLGLLFLAACRTVSEPEAPSAGLETAAASAPASLRTVSVPRIQGLGDYVKDEAAAVALGKALFWDQATGSDGLACASCHFQAGADNRLKNQLSPGLTSGDTSFQRTASGSAGGPNYILKAADFPLHQFANPKKKGSRLKFTTNDVVSSQGVYLGHFTGSSNGSHNDACERVSDPVFHVRGISTRRVEPRNSPSTINAALNFRNFWDGRANNAFNGVDPFGLRNSGARVLWHTGGGLEERRVELRNASLASQGVGPAVSDIEMICQGRSFASFGRKMIPRVALSLQTVHPEDSVLGALRDTATGKGLTRTYEEMIKAAFQDALWSADGPADGSFTQMENNFSLFWGIALQLYQATLISDAAPYDRWAEGSASALTKRQLNGLDVFVTKGKCIACHKGPEFSSAASVLQAEHQEGGLVERMRMGDGGVALYDNGFYNIGVTRTAADIGLGGTDPFGNPLSFSQQYAAGRLVDAFRVDPCSFEEPFNPSRCSDEPAELGGERLAVRGAFKTPILRNVELTGPYFHDGSAASLEQVVQFYNRGGNFNNPEQDPDITELGLSDREVKDLVLFMQALTDPRVKNESAPFDHPQLFVPNGHPGKETMTQGGEFEQANMALSEWLEVPAVGGRGRSASGLSGLRDFAWTLRNRGPDLRLARPFSPGNQAPELPAEPDRVNRVGDTVDYQFAARDPDGNRIFYSASGLPTGVRLNIQGRLRGQVRRAGEYLVTVVAYDGQLGTTSTTFTWTVLPRGG